MIGAPPYWHDGDNIVWWARFSCSLDVSPTGAIFMAVSVRRTRFRDCRVHARCPDVYFWVQHGPCGVWPGTDSDEWIEYIPECT